ncbi:MAG: hypothetical protein EB012_05735, partial [Gammaproteobacteria bacterium]|nr:hypothetical protein [Gammaproteobacteria bacterium]
MMENLLIETHLPVWQPLLVGGLLGMVFTLMILRSRLKMGEGLLIERAVLLERLSTLNERESRLREDVDTTKQQWADDRLRFDQVNIENARLKEKADHLESLEQQYEGLHLRYQHLLKTQTESETLLEAERLQHEDKVRLLLEARESLSHEFKV